MPGCPTRQRANSAWQFGCRNRPLIRDKVPSGPRISKTRISLSSDKPKCSAGLRPDRCPLPSPQSFRHSAGTAGSGDRLLANRQGQPAPYGRGLCGRGEGHFRTGGTGSLRDMRTERRTGTALCAPGFHEWLADPALWPGPAQSHPGADEAHSVAGKLDSSHWHLPAPASSLPCLAWTSLCLAAVDSPTQQPESVLWVAPGQRSLRLIRSPTCAAQRTSEGLAKTSAWCRSSGTGARPCRR